MEEMNLEPDLRVAIGPLLMPNPVGVASGTFGYGQEYEELVDIDRLGALYTKAVTREAREGNPPPRLVETPKGLINSIGLANPGLETFIGSKLPFLSQRACPIIVNVAGSTEADYIAVVEGIESAVGDPDRIPIPAWTVTRSTSPAPTSPTAAWLLEQIPHRWNGSPPG